MAGRTLAVAEEAVWECRPGVAPLQLQFLSFRDGDEGGVCGALFPRPASGDQLAEVVLEPPRL